MLMALQSCGGDSDFTIQEQDCGAIVICAGGHTITLTRDTVWHISAADGAHICTADDGKISALFNVFRDIQIMGSSTYSPDGKFDYEIHFQKSPGRDIKCMKFNAVPGSPMLVGSVDGGKCYIVGVPGLNINPSANLQPAAEYWKNRSLLEINGAGISLIAVNNLIDRAQSFTISTNVDAYTVQDADGHIVDIPTEKVRQFLGSISGEYRAESYVDNISPLPEDMIYQLKIRNRLGMEDSIFFYKKYINETQPDFNKMYFRKGGEVGCAKYFDFDNLLVDLDRLKR